jgi:tetratricopeptide (TPR) repeat protein
VHFRELGEIRLRVLGPEAPDTLWALAGLARVLSAAERHAPALEAFGVLHEYSTMSLGPEGDDTLAAGEGYAWELGKLGELDKARARWQELANAYERTHGPKYERTLECLLWLAETQEKLEEHYAARSNYERIAGPYGPLHAQSRETNGPDDPRTLRMGHNLGLTMERLGQLDSAMTMYKSALEGYVRIYSPRHRKVGDMKAHIGDVLCSKGDPAGARARYAESLAILRKFPGPDDPDTIEVVLHDADALLAMGRKVAARHQARLALESLRRTLGPDNPLSRRAEARLERMTPRRRKAREAAEPVAAG